MKLIKKDNKLFTQIYGGEMIEHDSAGSVGSELMLNMTPANIMALGTRYLGRQVNIAIDMLDHNGHNVAEFGVHGSFMYTYQDEAYEG